MIKPLFRILFVAITLSSSVSVLSAQDNTNFGAKEYLRYRDYNRALFQLLKLEEKYPNDLYVLENIGICYLNINTDRSKALPYLKKVYNAGNYKDEILLYLGIASMHAHNFDEAITFFEEFKKISGNMYPDDVELYINNCENAKALIKAPKNVAFINLGKNINTKYPEFLPFVTSNQDVLYFTSGREANLKKIESSEGFFTTDIYYSNVREGQWMRARGMRRVNTIEDEQCVYISPDGNNMIIYLDNNKEYGDIFLSTKPSNSRGFTIPKPLGEPANSKYLEMQGTIFGEGTRLIVSSNRPGGQGGLDLYLFRKLPDGSWGLPVNLGENINTKYGEAYPSYDEKNKILYFASQGHTNMGGYDIFKSKFDEETQTFGPAVNMGYPINNTMDNVQFTLAGNKRDGYMAMYRPEGYGDLDIYKVEFREVEVQLAVIKGVVTMAPDSLNPKELDAYITISDVTSGKDIEGRSLNPKTGKFVFAVEPGVYKITVDNPGFVTYEKVINVYEKSDYVFENEHNIVLRRPEITVVPGTGQGKVLQEVQE